MHTQAVPGSTALSESMSERGWRPAFVWGEDECQTAGQRAHTEPTTGSAVGAELPARAEQPRPTSGVCDIQPSLSRELVPVQQPVRVMRKACVFDDFIGIWRYIMQVVSSFVPEPAAPHITPPDFVPNKEMNCKECSIKFLNLDTWTQHQAVAHGMKLRDWRSVYERRDGLKRNRALAWYRQCLKEHPPRRPPIVKQSMGDNIPTHTGTILVNYISGGDTMVVDKELLAWMQEYKQCSAHYEHWFASKQMQIHCNLLGVTAVNTLLDKEPSAKPLLVTTTTWKSTDGDIVQIPTLLDTGCNTSIIHSSLIGKLLSVDGTVPKVKILHGATVLTAASGENMRTDEFCEAMFGFKGKQLTHRMYILDTLACHQKLLLGMDFIREQQLNIDMGKDTITLPETQECTPLFCTFAVCIEPQDTIAIRLSPLLGYTLPADATGYLYADPSLDEGLIMLEGVQTTSDGNVTAWLTNTTNASLNIEAGEAIALWEPDMDGEFELADALNNEVVLVVNALKTEYRRNKERKAAARHTY